MCDPVSMAITQFVISAASSVTGFMGDKAAAEQQNQLAANNRIESNRAAVDSYASTNNRMLQEQKAASGELQKSQTEALKARGSATVAAGEAGVTGLSVDNLLADFYGEEGRYERTLSNNLAMTQDYLRGEQVATQHQTAGRINSVQKAQKPSFLPTAVGILGGAVNAYGNYNQTKPKG